MDMRRLGPDGPQISVVGFGAWEAGGSDWGPNESEDQIVEAIHAGLEEGMNWVDTAEVYGPHRSEEIVGRAVAGRNDVLVFTKVAPDEGGSGFAPDQIRSAIRGSLSRLGLDHLDLYQLHWPDHSGVPMEDTWGTMGELQDEGLVRRIGVSNFSRQRIERCMAIRQVDSVQMEFSLLVQEDRAELLPWLAAQNITYLAYSPLGAGILTGAFPPDHVFPDDDWRSGKLWDEEQNDLFLPANFEENIAKTEKLRVIADRLETTPAALALRWVIEAASTSAAIAGSRDPDHTRANAQAGVLRLDSATLAEIDAIFE